MAHRWGQVILCHCTHRSYFDQAYAEGGGGVLSVSTVHEQSHLDHVCVSHCDRQVESGSAV